jgi:hypothetical protein
MPMRGCLPNSPFILFLQYRRGGLAGSHRVRNFIILPPLTDIFHPPYPPIASQSISRDVPLAQPRGVFDRALREYRESAD